MPSLSSGAPRRHYLKQEPYAEEPHVRVCAGRRATGVPTATQGIELIRNTYMTNGQFNTPLNDFKSFNGVCIVRLKEQKAERLMKIRGGININYISYI